MEFINLYDMCDIKAQKGINELKKYVNSIKDLIYTEIEEDNIITITIEYFIDDDCILTDLLGVWEFDINGNFIE